MPVIFSLITLGIYLLILIPVCIRAKNQNLQHNATDHYLANRSLGLLVLLLTMYATTISGNVMGVSAKAYRMGYTWIMFAGLISAISCSFHLLIPKLRPLSVQHHFVTPGDWIRYRFNAPGLRVLITLVLILAIGNYLLAQLKAAGEIIDVMTQNTIPYELGVVGFALIILIYDSLGGLRAVAWTDAVQGLVMMAGFTSLAIWVVETSDGLSNLAHAIAELRPESVPVPDMTTQVQWFQPNDTGQPGGDYLPANPTKNFCSHLRQDHFSIHGHIGNYRRRKQHDLPVLRLGRHPDLWSGCQFSCRPSHPKITGALGQQQHFESHQLDDGSTGGSGGHHVDRRLSTAVVSFHCSPRPAPGNATGRSELR